MIRILTDNGTDNTNIDDARFKNLSTGRQSGRIRRNKWQLNY